MNNIAYIDESGSSSLDTSIESVGRYFVVCATFIDVNEIEHVNNAIDKIRKDEFSGSELKSSGIGKDLQRRLRIIEKLNALNIRTHIICIDKSKISKDSGLIYKKPFLKYVNGLLYRKMLKTFPDLTIYFDKVGDSKYQDSFVKYIDRYHKTDFFKTSTIIPVDSKESNGVQISDVFAGSLNSFLQNRNSDLWDRIKAKSICIDVWPPERQLFHIQSNNADEFDKVVEDYCVNQVKIYLETHSNSDDDDDQLRCGVLEFLLYKNLDEDGDPFTYTQEILDYIHTTNANASEYYFRTKIIGKLRDDDVIIASSQKGLKIPSCVQDLTGYAEESMKKILPMLSRLSRARNQVFYTTNRSLDILENYEIGKRLLNFLENEKMV